MTYFDIVIIDSGVNNDNACGICIEKKNDHFIISNTIEDEIGHGTIIYSIISKKVNPDKIYVIKLSKKIEEYDDSYLIAALEFVKHNISCKIINVSLGVKSSENIGKLHKICFELSQMGVVIISAFDNEGCYSYPAAFDCVIGVDSRSDIKSTQEFYFVEKSPINIFAKGNLQRLTSLEGKTILISGSSIACAHITSFLSVNITSELNLRNALLFLRENANYIFPCQKEDNYIYNNFFTITNAVVFPFAKEAHAFVRFADTLSFNIHNYYDIRSSGKVGRKISSFIENIDSDKFVMNIDQIDLTNIDTIILGHLDELNSNSKRDYKEDLIKLAIAVRVNIYSFDPLDSYNDLLKKSKIKYFYPRVTQNDVPHNTFGKLYKIAKPVVGIFGTSSHQGKFSLQLALKKELESLDYNVGTIGTEPHSLLFDFDVVFPMGYNATVDLKNNEIVSYLNYMINNLCLNEKEIILVATQAQIVPYYGNNLQEFPNMQYHFALGTKPDAIIMCINYHDEISYIRNSVYALMGLTDATIIALVMYPITYSDDWNGIYGNAKHRITYDEFKKKADLLLKELQIPVYFLGEKNHISDICQSIIDFF